MTSIVVTPVVGIGANVLVTGANRGIGLGLVQALLKTPGVQRVFAACRQPEQAKVSYCSSSVTKPCDGSSSSPTEN